MQATTTFCSKSCMVYLLVAETCCKNICRAMAIFFDRTRLTCWHCYELRLYASVLSSTIILYDVIHVAVAGATIAKQLSIKQSKCLKPIYMNRTNYCPEWWLPLEKFLMFLMRNVYRHKCPSELYPHYGLSKINVVWWLKVLVKRIKLNFATPQQIIEDIIATENQSG